MANVLPHAMRTSIITALCEGNSIRAVERMTGVAKSTILRLALAVGDGCERLHNKLVRGVRAPEIECDEQWSFVQKKAARVTEQDPSERGDAWTFVGFCRLSKLVISYHVGKRDQANTDAFMMDLRGRVMLVPQVTTDGFAGYASAVGAAFMGSVDYGQVIKQYGYNRSPDHKYEPARDAHFIKKTAIMGAPSFARMSTSHVERFNLTTRHMVGRTRRLCLAFSKTLRGHRAGIALGVMAYNFTRIHSTIRVTPAMEAGLTDHVWDISELVTEALACGEEAKPAPSALTLREGSGPMRELPNGRGFLRLVTPGGAPAPRAPAPPPVAPSPAPAAQAPEVTAEPSGQLDLLAWRPKPREPEQLNLFERE